MYAFIKKTSWALIIIYCFQFLHAQQLQCNVDFIKAIGGISYDQVYSSFGCNDGNIIITGQTASTDFGAIISNDISNSFFVCKIDWNGNIIWRKNIGRTNYNNQIKYENNSCFEINDTIFTINVTQIITNNIDTISSLNDCCMSKSNFSIKKWNSNDGTLLNEICFDLDLNSSNRECSEIHPSKLFIIENGDIIIFADLFSSGRTLTHFGNELFANYSIIKIDRYGNLKNSDIYSRAEYSDEVMNVTKLNNSLFLSRRVKSIDHFNNNFKTYNELVKIDTSLHTINTYQTDYSSGPNFYTQLNLFENNLYFKIGVFGAHNVEGVINYNNTRLFTYQTDTSGNILKYNYLCTPNIDNIGFDNYIKIDTFNYLNGGSITNINESYDYFFNKYSQNFSLLYSSNIPNISNGTKTYLLKKSNQNIFMHILNSHNNIYATHNITNDFFYPDIILIRTSESYVGANNPLQEQIQMKLLPNPSSANTSLILNTQNLTLSNVRISVLDISGKILFVQKLESPLLTSYKTIPLNTEKLNAGVYFITFNGSLQQTELSKTIKFVKQ